MFWRVVRPDDELHVAFTSYENYERQNSDIGRGI